MQTKPSFQIRLEASGEKLADVHVRRLVGREAISELYQFDVDVLCATDNGLPSALALGSKVTLAFEQDGAVVRRVHGFVFAVDAAGQVTAGYRAFRLAVVPRLHQMTMVHSASIYTNARLDKVLASQLRKFEFIAPGSAAPHDYELQLLDATPERALVIQYGETDMAFVSRLTEHQGVSFFFEQTDDHDRVVFTDHNERFRPCVGAEVVKWNPEGASKGVYELRESSRMVPGFYNVTGYNYLKPELSILGEYELSHAHTAGGFVEQDSKPRSPEDARALATIRAEEQACRQIRYRGKSAVAAFAAGTRTTLVDQPMFGATGSKELLLVEVTHEAVLPAPWEEETEATYHNEFVAFPVERRFRPERKTLKPKMPGVVSAIVQPLAERDSAFGAVDEQGRYRVHFMFDLEPLDRVDSSSWLRMAQPFEGAKGGMHFPLRAGTEVIVGFVNGDPDDPIILGAVPNALAPSPVDSKNAHLQRIKTEGIVIEFGRTEGAS